MRLGLGSRSRPEKSSRQTYHGSGEEKVEVCVGPGRIRFAFVIYVEREHKEAQRQTEECCCGVDLSPCAKERSVFNRF